MICLSRRGIGGRKLIGVQQINPLSGSGDGHGQGVKGPFTVRACGVHIQSGFGFGALQRNGQVREAPGILLLNIAHDKKAVRNRRTQRRDHGGIGFGAGNRASVRI